MLKADLEPEEDLDHYYQDKGRSCLAASGEDQEPIGRT